MDVWCNRFNSRLDECVHLVLALYLSELFDEQRIELIDNYGNDLLMEAVHVIDSQYGDLVRRLIVQ